MEASTAASPARMPWNKGKLTGQKPPLKLKEIWAIRIRLQLAARTRDLAMFNLAASNQGVADLPPNEKPAGGSVAARSHETGKHSSIPRHRSRRCTRDGRADRGLNYGQAGW